MPKGIGYPKGSKTVTPKRVKKPVKVTPKPKTCK